MKNIQYSILIFLFGIIIVNVGCKKENTTTQDSSVQSNAMLKNYQDASNNDALLVKYHQQAALGNHDSCYYYWNQFHQYDSLFSYHFYEYCRTIYANNGGTNFSNMEWNWDNEDGEMHNGNWQCGLDTLQFQNWNGYGDCKEHDNQMYNLMQYNGMTGYFSTQGNQYYSNMQGLRADHYNNHNYHW